MLIDARGAADVRPPEINKGRRRRTVQLGPDKQTAKKHDLVWRNRKKISQICLPFFLLIILSLIVINLSLKSLKLLRGTTKCHLTSPKQYQYLSFFTFQYQETTSTMSRNIINKFSCSCDKIKFRLSLFELYKLNLQYIRIQLG
jgi:hypothetical protein